MASVYRRTRKERMPVGAVIRETRKSMPANAKLKGDRVTWIDRQGMEIQGIATADGSKVVVCVATWTTESGSTNSAPTTTDRKQILRRGKTYQAKYVGSGGKDVRQSTGTSDRESAQRIADKWEAESKLRKTGVVDERAEKMSVQARRPIGELLEAFADTLVTKKNTPNYCTRVRMYVQEFIDVGGWKQVSHITAESVNRHAASLLKAGMAPRTVNARLTAVKGFTKWMVPDHWHTNPLVNVSKPNPDSGRKLERRMLLPDEWLHLRAAAEIGPEIAGLSNEDRVTLYMLAIQTGLRVNELASLTPGKVVLSDKSPHVLCKAAGTKNKKPAKQYIDKELAQRLQALVGRKKKSARLFEFEDQNRVADVLRADLASARQRWIDEATTANEVRTRMEDDFLSRVNAEGESLDFHALRHTTGAWLAIAGVHPKVIQSVMRHGTITLTMDRYMHLFPGEDEGAVDNIAAVMQRKVETPTRRIRDAG